MTEKTSSGYENIYPKTLRSLVERSVSNASSLDGTKASNYLKKTEAATKTNLDVYVNTLVTYSLSLESKLMAPISRINYSSYADSTQSLFIGNIGGGEAITGKSLSEENNVWFVFYPTLEIKQSQSDYSYSREGFGICAPPGSYTLNTNNKVICTKNSYLEWVCLIPSNTYILSSGKYGWSLRVVSGD